MNTLYNLTKKDAKILLNSCENNVENLGLLLWNRGKAKTLEIAVKKAIKLKKFAYDNL